MAKKTPRAFVGETTARVETLRSRALEMLLQRKSCTEIGESLGVHRTRAHQLAKEALETLIQETIGKAEEWRVVLSSKWMKQLVEGEALQERALRGTDGLALDVLDSANAMIERALAELGKLWGAYAAVKTQATVAADITTKGEAVAAVGGLSALSDEQLKLIQQAHQVAKQAA